MQYLILATVLVSISITSASAAVPVYDCKDVGTYFREWLLCGPMPLGDGLEVTTGEATEAARVLNLFDRYDPARAVVVPTTLVQDHQ